MKRAYTFQRKKEAAESSLVEFIRQAWSIIEPGQEYVEGWHVTAMAMHLEHCFGGEYEGEISRLLINIPPGHMKSLMGVFYNAWLWGPKNRPWIRFLCASHAQTLAIRDTMKFRRLIMSEWYQKRWGDRVKIAGDQNAKTKIESTATGFREAVAAGGITGSRGDIVWLDDPMSVEDANSEARRASIIEWFLEAVPTRLNNPAAVYDDDGGIVKPASVIIVVMQRLNEDDVSGVILEKNLGYEHLMLPAEYEPDRKCVTSIGFEDHRTELGEILFPQRFPREVLERDKKVMGPYAYAGQMQQRPAPAGGAIIKRHYWQLWDDNEAMTQGVKSGNNYPQMDFILVSVDSAFSLRQESDASYVTVWGIWQRGGGSAKSMLAQGGAKIELLDSRDTMPCAMLMWAKELFVPMHGEAVERGEHESKVEFTAREKESWGLVEWIAYAAKTYNADRVIIEAKANGITVAQELKRIYKTSSWDVEMINPGAIDKVARCYAIQPIFTNGQVFAPDKSWADHLITQAEVFPKGRRDDGVDAMTQAIRWLREKNMLQRQDEISAQINHEGTWRPKDKPVYDI
jgi:predicted phage terminase large subunit-like protein